MNLIMVQAAEKRWTIQAMHLACAMARNTHAKIVLLHLLPVSNPMLLGSSVGTVAPTPEESQAMKEYASVAEDYGVEIDLMPYQYESLVDALVQAAEEQEAAVVFAHLPEGGFALWRKYQAWSLQRQLQRQKRQLCTIETNKEGSLVPTVSLRAVK